MPISHGNQTACKLGASPPLQPSSCSQEGLRNMGIMRGLRGRIRTLLQMTKDFACDLLRYYRYSATVDEAATSETLIYRITARLHVIEKGLSMKEPRVGFGQPLVLSLLTLLELYLHRFGPHEVVEAAASALNEYVFFNSALGGNTAWMGERLDQINAFTSRSVHGLTGGTRLLRRPDILTSADDSFKKLVAHRRSIRQFNGREVPTEVIRRAVELALHAPSACNRQAWRTHCLCGTTKHAALACQSGNRGFGNEIPSLLLVTGNLAAFYGSGERNQVFVDSGMFTMCLILALQSEGLVTCALNCCYTHNEEMALRRAIMLSKSEIPVVMLAVGYPADEFKVPISSRRSLDAFLKIHKD